MLALGAHALGTEPLAGDPLHDPPTVEVTAPAGTVDTGGPVVSVAWTFDQVQGDPQEWYRVLATNDAGTTTHYDSGWLEGDAASHDVDVDVQHIPPDSSDVTWTVQVRGPEAIGTGVLARYQADDDSAVVMDWGAPEATITAPVDDAVVTEASGLTVSWTFSDGANTQSAYRVRLKYATSGEVVFSTGWVPSAATTVDLDYLLRDSTQYIVELQLRNNHGIASS